MSLVMAVLWQVIAADLYFLGRIIMNDEPTPQDAHSIARTDRLYRVHAAILFLFYSTLWCIKFSFLFFFRRVYLNLGELLRLWWAIFIFTVMAWVACVGTIDYRCLRNGPWHHQLEYCHSIKSYDLKFGNMISSCVLDIATDMTSKKKKARHRDGSALTPVRSHLHSDQHASEAPHERQA